jgi:hypothetical protein
MASREKEYNSKLPELEHQNQSSPTSGIRLTANEVPRMEVDYNCIAVAQHSLVDSSTYRCELETRNDDPNPKNLACEKLELGVSEALEDEYLAHRVIEKHVNKIQRHHSKSTTVARL